MGQKFGKKSSKITFVVFMFFMFFHGHEGFLHVQMHTFSRYPRFIISWFSCFSWFSWFSCFSWSPYVYHRIFMISNWLYGEIEISKQNWIHFAFFNPDCFWVQNVFISLLPLIFDKYEFWAKPRLSKHDAVGHVPKTSQKNYVLVVDVLDWLWDLTLARERRSSSTKST